MMINRNDKFNFINNLPFFKNINNSIIIDNINYFEIQDFRKGKYILYQDDKSNFAYYQTNGFIVEEKLCSNNSFLIGNFTIDKWYGLEELLLDVNYFHDVYTKLDTRVISISKYNLKNLLKIEQIKDSIYREVLKNYKIIENKIDTITPYKKIVKYLLSYSDDKDQFEITTTQEQISVLLNFTRETINKYLKKMEKDNIIKITRGNIKILDIEKLKMLLDE
jgi:CRP/FNR family transcriptional regulator